MELLALFTSEDSRMDSVRVHKTIYFPDPYVGIFLKRNLTPDYAWRCLLGAIVDAGAKADYKPIIDWIRVSLMQESREDHPYPLAMPQPTNLFIGRDLLRHRNHILIRHIPKHNPALQRVQGYLIASHIEEMALDLQQDREDKMRVREQAENKGVTEFLGTNIT